MVLHAEDIIRKVDSLSDADQVLVASYLSSHFEEIVDDARWQESFSRSKTLFEKMGEEVDAAIRGGDVAPLNLEEL